MIDSLSDPVDIPWKHLAISKDIYARSIEKGLPLKWSSSLAVYYYEPPVNEKHHESDDNNHLSQGGGLNDRLLACFQKIDDYPLV